MPKIVLEKYENGVLVERRVEGSRFKVRKWLQLFIQLTIAISLAILAAVAVHDSLTMANVLNDDSEATSCGQPQLHS